MNNILELTPAQLRKAAHIKDQIVALERQLQQILGEKGNGASGAPSRGLSAAARAKISAAAKARWARFRAGQKTISAKSNQKRGARKMSAAQKAKIAAAMKARWAKVKAEKGE